MTFEVVSQSSAIATSSVILSMGTVHLLQLLLHYKVTFALSFRSHPLRSQSPSVLNAASYNMAKKKKTALKPVARGFATTSQPKKVVPEAVSEEPPAIDDPAQDQNDTHTKDNKPQDGQTGEGVDWEDDSKLEEGIYQGYVERLQEKGDREVAKIMKVSKHG